MKKAGVNFLVSFAFLLFFSTSFLFGNIDSLQKDSLLNRRDSAGFNTQQQDPDENIIGLQTLNEAGIKPLKAKRKFNPKTAALLSGIIPGAGQAYNKKYWKVPIVYGALGYVVYQIYTNYELWKQLSFALEAFNKAAKMDSTDFKQVDPIIQKLTLSSIQSYKNNFRKGVDENSLWLLLVWGLNVLDAGVDAHLKSYDVSDNLSLKIQPQIIPQPINQSINYQLNVKLLFKHSPKKSKYLISSLTP